MEDQCLNIWGYHSPYEIEPTSLVTSVFRVLWNLGFIEHQNSERFIFYKFY